MFDEPTAMLDPSGRKEVMDSAKQLNREDGITIVFITHYMDEAVQADRVIVVDDGKIKKDGTPQEVFSDVDGLKELGLDVPQSTELLHKLNFDNKTEKTILNSDECADFLASILE